MAKKPKHQKNHEKSLCLGQKQNTRVGNKPVEANKKLCRIGFFCSF